MNSNPLRSASRQSAVKSLLLSLLLFQGNWLNAQESVRAVFQKEGVDWIVGRWTGTNEQGRDITICYEWDLEGHVLELDLTIGDMGYKGMLVRRPTDGRLIEFGADSTGGVTRSRWRMEEGTLISERTGARAEEPEVRVAVVSKKVDENTFIATVHALSEDGAMGDETLDTVKLTRQSRSQDSD